MSHFTFKEPCSSCGAVPSYNGHGLCEVCVTGNKNERNTWAKSLEDGGFVELSDEPLFAAQPKADDELYNKLYKALCSCCGGYLEGHTEDCGVNNFEAIKTYTDKAVQKEFEALTGLNYEAYKIKFENGDT
jgi:hypothetical protein